MHKMLRSSAVYCGLDILTLAYQLSNAKTMKHYSSQVMLLVFL